LAIAVPQRIVRIVTWSVGWQPGELPTQQAHAYWYQWFVTTKRGRQVVRSNGKAFARTQWENWSLPGWVNDAEFEQTAKSFENLDWPEITWHSYSVRWGEAYKDPSYVDLDCLVTAAQSISTPTLMIQGGSDAVTLPDTTEFKDKYFTGGYAQHVLSGRWPFPDPRSTGRSKWASDGLSASLGKAPSTRPACGERRPYQASD
jgi:hypothetical protein